MASQLVEDWAELGTTAVLLDRMKPFFRRLNDSLEAHIPSAADSDTYSAIPASGAHKVLVQLPLAASTSSAGCLCTLWRAG
eukprot:14948836-Alexandrium_andersonii.AAC.1